MIAKFFWSWHRRCAGRDSGSLAVEVAVAAPVLITLLLGAVDYGMLMNTAASLRGATRAGAEYAKANWNNPSYTSSQLTTNTQQKVCGFLGLALSGGSCSPLTPGVTTSCICADDATVTCPASGAANPCSSGHGSDTRLLISVNVTVSRSFSPIVSWASFAFPANVSAATVVRTQ